VRLTPSASRSAGSLAVPRTCTSASPARHGDGFTIANLLYESRPGLWVTANLYQPKPVHRVHAGIIICHSHHNPKTQGELQDWV